MSSPWHNPAWFQCLFRGPASVLSCTGKIARGDIFFVILLLKNIDHYRLLARLYKVFVWTEVFEHVVGLPFVPHVHTLSSNYRLASSSILIFNCSSCCENRPSGRCGSIIECLQTLFFLFFCKILHIPCKTANILHNDKISLPF